MNFNVNDYSVGNSVSKILEPGTHECRILDIKAGTPSYDLEKKTFQLTFTLEGKPEGGSFVGCAIDKNDPSKGNYEGRIGFVNNGQYAFKDWTTPKGEFITKENQAFSFLNNLAINLGVFEEAKKNPIFAKEDISFDEYFQVIKKYICDPDLWAFYTIGGKQKWTEGYDRPNYTMFFPKYADRKSFVGLDINKVIVFDPENEKHIIKVERGVPVTAQADTIPTTEADPFV